MHASKDKNSYPWLPPELLFFFGPALIAFPTLVAWPILRRVREGDPLLPFIALGLALLGIALLFVARLPLYRQRRFLVFGPALLDSTHRKLYRCAYVFIASAVLLLGLICLIV